VDEDAIASIRKATEGGENRKRGLGAFYRKGIGGDWRGTLSNEILEDIDKRVDGTL
jgi:hypothetical protein